MPTMSFIKKNILIPCLISATAMCCNNREKKSGEGSTMSDTGKPECYLHVQGSDSIKLSIESHHGQVEGKLDFRFYEKDKSTGTIQGEIKGDTVFANYKFTSEGMESNREVALLKKENSFVIGYGEILNSGNKDIFKNRDAINFSDGVVLTKVACK